jgi:hypothetical protein
VLGIWHGSKAGRERAAVVVGERYQFSGCRANQFVQLIAGVTSV